MYTGSLAPATTRQSWSETFNIYDDETGAPVDLTGATIVLQVRKPGQCVPVLSADVQIIDTGVFEASLTLAQMRTLCAETYEVGCTVLKDGETSELMLATLPILDGVVS